MFLDTIRVSDVRPGDHLYFYRWFRMQQGIAVQFPKLAQIFVVTAYHNTLSLMTLNEFKGRHSLRRVCYNRCSNCLNKMQLCDSRPPEEIVQNAFLLLNWVKTSPERVRLLFANDLSQFARKCCTTVHEHWSNLFYLTQAHALLNKPMKNSTSEQTNRKSSAFNTALLCGMPYWQALSIGTGDFWADDHSANSDQ